MIRLQTPLGRDVSVELLQADLKKPFMGYKELLHTSIGMPRLVGHFGCQCSVMYLKTGSETKKMFFICKIHYWFL